MISFEENIDHDIYKDDVLWIMRKISIDYFHYKVVKILLTLLSIGITILTVIQTFLFLERFEGRYFVKYAPAYIATFLMVVAMQYISFSIRLAALIKRITFWTINSARVETERKIKKHAMYTNIFFLGTVIMGVISALFHIMPLDDDNELFFPLILFEEFVPNWKNFFSWMYRLNFLAVPFTLPIPIYITTYHLIKSYYQILLYLDFLKNINTGFDTTSSNNIESAEYQQVTRDRLVFCIKRHSYFYTQMREVNRKMSKFIAIFALISVLLGGSVLTFLFSFQGTFENRYPRIVTLILTAGCIFAHVIYAGQLIEEAATQVCENLKVLDWYHWNCHNRKLYLIFLQNTQKPYKTQFSQNVSINYELGLSIIKTVYSLISVLRNLQDIN
ncbi:odorant receptor 293 [Tribolium castaneum]|uniref:Odorant receptor n=1 Tax=Tribolium castaneum TaxID=7070 RepID=D6WEU9_TRICA|nr:odorant receptor 293 [Tribolium castaneum]